MATHPIRPVLYFYGQEGYLIDPESMVDLTEDLEVTEDGALNVRTETRLAAQAGGIATAAAIRNLGEEALVVSCRLMSGGIVLEEVEISLEANGQEARYIEELFTGTDTSDFVGSVRCTLPPGEGMFTGVAVELDASNQIFTTLRDPVVQGLSRSREGGVMCRDEEGAQRLDAPVTEAGSVFRVLLLKKGESLLPSRVGLGRF